MTEALDKATHFEKTYKTKVADLSSTQLSNAHRELENLLLPLYKGPICKSKL